MKWTSMGRPAAAAPSAAFRIAQRSSFLSTTSSTTRCTPLSALTLSVVTLPFIAARCSGRR